MKEGKQPENIIFLYQQRHINIKYFFNIFHKIDVS